MTVNTMNVIQCNEARVHKNKGKKQQQQQPENLQKHIKPKLKEKVKRRTNTFRREIITDYLLSKGPKPRQP